MITIRPVTAADSPQWVALKADLWPDETVEAHRVAAESFLANPAPTLGMMPEAVFVAVHADAQGEAIVGFAEVSRRLYAEGCGSSPVGFLEGWFVARSFRQQQVGRALVEAAEAWASALGCQEFASDALADNLLSATAHKALGFDEVEVIRCFRKALKRASAS